MPKPPVLDTVKFHFPKNPNPFYFFFLSFLFLLNVTLTQSEIPRRTKQLQFSIYFYVQGKTGGGRNTRVQYSQCSHEAQRFILLSLLSSEHCNLQSGLSHRKRKRSLWWRCVVLRHVAAQPENQAHRGFWKYKSRVYNFPSGSAGIL